MLLPDGGAAAVVIAGTQGELVRDDEVEGDRVGFPGLKDPGTGNGGGRDWHPQLHKRAERVRGVLLDEIKASGRDAREDDVNVIKRSVSLSLDNGLPRDGRPDV